jgi:hypothetical protein
VFSERKQHGARWQVRWQMGTWVRKELLYCAGRKRTRAGSQWQDAQMNIDESKRTYPGSFGTRGFGGPPSTRRVREA